MPRIPRHQLVSQPPKYLKEQSDPCVTCALLTSGSAPCLVFNVLSKLRATSGLDNIQGIHADLLNIVNVLLPGPAGPRRNTRRRENLARKRSSFYANRVICAMGGIRVYNGKPITSFPNECR